MSAISVTPTARHVQIIRTILATAVPTDITNGKRIRTDAPIIARKARILREESWVNTLTRHQVLSVEPVSPVTLVASSVPILTVLATNAKTITISWMTWVNVKLPFPITIAVPYVRM